jgi:S1-C subfamily serine protease
MASMNDSNRNSRLDFTLVALIAAASTLIACGQDREIVREEEFSWAPVVEDLESASYAVGLLTAEGEFILVGSGVAVRSDAILTNAHVALGLIEGLSARRQLGDQALAVARENGGAFADPRTLVLDRLAIHPEYVPDRVFSPDLAVLFLDEQARAVMPIADAAVLEDIRVGDAVGTLGYPGETRDLWSERVVATFKSGVVSALGRIALLDGTSPPGGNLIQHDMSVTPGTSGSPIFGPERTLLAVNSAGTVQRIFDEESGTFVYIPVASIGYGVRADLAEPLLRPEGVDVDTLSRLVPPVVITGIPPG